MKNKPDFYTYRVHWSEEDKIHICRCLEFKGLQTHGRSPEKAIKECKLAVEAAIETLEQDAKAVPKPISKKRFPQSFPLRLSEDLRRELELEAAEKETSLNQLIQKKLAQ